MTTFVLGTGAVAFTLGVGTCEERGGVSLPFFAFGDSDKIEAELDVYGTVEFHDEEGVQRTLDAYAKHGTIVFLDNYEATEQFLSYMMRLVNVLTDTPWMARNQQRETLQ